MRRVCNQSRRVSLPYNWDVDSIMWTAIKNDTRGMGEESTARKVQGRFWMKLCKLVMGHGKDEVLDLVRALGSWSPLSSLKQPQPGDMGLPHGRRQQHGRTSGKRQEATGTTEARLANSDSLMGNMKTWRKMRLGCWHMDVSKWEQDWRDGRGGMDGG